MKRKVELMSFIVVAVSMIFSSCESDQIPKMQAEIDSLATANKTLMDKIELMTEELDGYRYSPEKLCAPIDDYLKNEDVSKLNEIEAQLTKYHPDCEQLGKVKSYIASILKTQQQRKEAERAKRLQAVKILETKYDDVQGIRWYYSKKRTRYGNYCYLYMGKKEGGTPWLRLSMQYKGEDWIFFKNAYLSYDGNTKEVIFDDYKEKETEVGEGVYEWIDVSVDSDLREFLEKLANGKTAKWQFRGKYQKTYTMSPACKEAIKEILLAYDVLLHDN